MGLNGQKIVVVGAGIGGLTAALCLRRRGAEVTVLEQAGAIREVGAGLQISPNGVAVLRALGLEDRLAQGAVRAAAVVLRDHATADEVLRLDLTGLAPDQAYYFVHRADLIDLLAEAARLAGVQVRLLQKVERVQMDGGTVLQMASGAGIRADLVVAAEGLHSRARVALNGDDAPFFTGQVAWRAVVPNDPGLGPEAQVFMGPGCHLVCYPMRGGKLANLVAVQERDAWADEGWHHFDDPANLRAAFAGFRGVAQDLLAQVDEVRLWGLFRHEVAENWCGPGLALLGDAAHPTLPFMAQGANMALEDAWVLADNVDRLGIGEAGLAAYQGARRDRVVRVVAAANGNAWKYHLRPGPVRMAAHLALRLGGKVAPGRMLHKFDWLYGVDVTA
jgi:2-polyprenyl-6-methoxyphenol hydroxylase-like FAD-dependent oxidoreductase